MITSYTEESPTRRSMTLEIPVEEVQKETEKTARSIARQARLPGFRPGKAPVAMIKKRYAEELKGEVLEHLIQHSVQDAMVEKNLVPLGRPKIEELKFELDAPLSFRVDLEIRPQVVPKDYRGLKVPSESVTPSADEVQTLLERLREGQGTYDPIEDRPAADGDFALVDIHGSFPQGDGKDFDAEKTMIEVGGERTMPEMSAHLRNAEPGMTVSFQKTFAGDVSDADFAGKTVLYSVNLIALKKRVLPAIDDEFARLALTPRGGEAPEGADLELLKKRVVESLTSEKEQALAEKKRRAVLDALLALNSVDAPDSMTDAEVDSALKEYARYVSRQGVDLKEANIDWNKMREEAREGAVRRVKEYLLLDAIGEAEGITVTDTELDAELKRRAPETNSSFSDLKAALVKADRLEGIREDVRISRVLEFLLAEAISAS
ncbi:MAG: trigger factor [Thermoanaerobaculia bacterium]